MNSSIKYLSILAVILSCASAAYAVQCYNCDSINSPKCGEKFEAEDAFKYDCSRVAPPRFLQTFVGVRNATGCIKKTLEGVNGARAQILRLCYWGDISNTEAGCRSDPSLPFIKQLSCEVCSGDLCNSAKATGPIAGAIALFFVLARMMS